MFEKSVPPGDSPPLSSLRWDEIKGRIFDVADTARKKLAGVGGGGGGGGVGGGGGGIKSSTPTPPAETPGDRLSRLCEGIDAISSCPPSSSSIDEDIEHNAADVIDDGGAVELMEA